jgi:hypothetical protein
MKQQISKVICGLIVFLIATCCSDNPVQPYATTVTVVFVRSDGGEYDSLYYTMYYYFDRPTEPYNGQASQWVEVGDSVVTNLYVDKTTDIEHVQLYIRPFLTGNNGNPSYLGVRPPAVIRPDKQRYRYEFFNKDSIVLTTR